MQIGNLPRHRCALHHRFHAHHDDGHHVLYYARCQFFCLIMLKHPPILFA